MDTSRIRLLAQLNRGLSGSPAYSDAASTLHWRMSDVSTFYTREGLCRARLRMLRYDGHGYVFAAVWDIGAAATPRWRSLDRERDHAWNSRSASMKARSISGMSARGSTGSP